MAAGRRKELASARSDRVRHIRASLLRWYDDHARDLPWRRTKDPYAIWVSEVMLQQTRVETVIPYYERFLKRFPSVEALADALEDDVLQAWSGLGYYRRARALHRASREVCESHGRRLPSTAAGLQSLYGIGPYTAGAIASIAFGERAPLVDGNVARVLSRLDATTSTLETGEGRRALWGRAGELVDPERPGDLNQALMELGATVCTVEQPRCEGCPLRSQCAAREQGRQHELPVRSERGAVPEQKLASIVLRLSDGRVWLGKRQHGGLFGGMWEPPMVEASPSTARRELVRRGLVLDRVRLRRGAVVRHVLTHRVFHVLPMWPASLSESAIQNMIGQVGLVAPLRTSWSSYTRFELRSPNAGGLSRLAERVLDTSLDNRKSVGDGVG